MDSYMMLKWKNPKFLLLNLKNDEELCFGQKAIVLEENHFSLKFVYYEQFESFSFI